MDEYDVIGVAKRGLVRGDDIRRKDIVIDMGALEAPDLLAQTVLAQANLIVKMDAELKAARIQIAMADDARDVTESEWRYHVALREIAAMPRVACCAHRCVHQIARNALSVTPDTRTATEAMGQTREACRPEPSPIQKSLTEWVQKSLTVALQHQPVVAFAAFLDAGGVTLDFNAGVTASDGHTYRIALERVE